MVIPNVHKVLVCFYYFEDSFYAKNLNTIHTWNAKKINTLANKTTTASLTELRTILIGKLCNIKTLLENETVLQEGTHPHGNKRNIQKINKLTMEVGAKFYQIEGGLTTNEINNFKTILTDIKNQDPPGTGTSLTSELARRHEQTKWDEDIMKVPFSGSVQLLWRPNKPP